MPLSVSCITFTLIIYTQTERQRERERKNERAGETESKHMCEAHKWWECKWSYSCEIAACCKESGLCRPTPCQRVFGQEMELWERVAKLIPACSPVWIKIVQRVIVCWAWWGTVKLINLSARLEEMIWSDSEQKSMFVCHVFKFFFKLPVVLKQHCQTFIIKPALVMLVLNTSFEYYKHSRHTLTHSFKASADPFLNCKQISVSQLSHYRACNCRPEYSERVKQWLSVVLLSIACNALAKSCGKPQGSILSHILFLRYMLALRYIIRVMQMVLS